MKKEERYKNAIECIIKIKSGDISYIYGLWLFLKPEAMRESKRLLSYTESRLCDLDDMMQESYFALLSTLDRYCFKCYDLDNLYQFIAYYKNAIRRSTSKMRALYLRHDPMLNTCSFDKKIGDDEEDDFFNFTPDETAEMRYQDVVQAIYLNDLRRAIKNLMEVLTPKESTVITEKYFNDLTFMQIASKHKIPIRVVIDTEKRALHKMKVFSEQVNLRSFLID